MSTSLSRSSSIYSTPPQTPSSGTPPPFIMCTDFLPNLSKDLSLLLSENEDYNMIINVGEQPNVKQFKVHSIILRVRSSYFRAALSSEWAKVENNYITFNKPNINPKIFEIILTYIYTGTIILDESISSDTMSILEVMMAADELCLQEMIDYAQDYLLLYKPGWIQRNFSTTHKIALEHSNTFTKLLDYCNEIIVNDPELVFCSEDFNSIDENTFISLLKRDDLLKDEVVLWNHLIKWGTSRASISKDLSNWSSKEYEILSEKIEKSISHIRFLHISSGDFYKRVKPFAQCLPPDLFEDILQYHLVPGHQPSSDLIQPKRATIDSVIIERKHAALLASWIDGKDELVQNKRDCLDNPYEFKLLLRGTRDGFTGTDFHQRCDSKSSTITIMKVSNTGELIGGFTPINWSSRNDWGFTHESFIFHLGEKNVVSRVTDPAKAINYYENYGPSFGRNDLKMSGNFKAELKCCCKQGDYEFPIRNDTNSFSIDEYEVFQVIPRRPNLMNLIV
ncbi:unnamed protein product [Rhizophagus irregularis]|nr:unnamed protein product [Rhizophagus irregularis]CAB5382767.1 unnamed protein product [Rhizophagus irregularis]